MPEELKPCPFCGGEAELLELPDPDKRSGWTIRCCYVDDFAYEHFSTSEETIAAWNARPDAAQVRVKPLDLSNMLQHAFLSGRDSQKGTGQTRMEAWAEYDPTDNAAYSRIRAALEPDNPVERHAQKLRDLLEEASSAKIIKQPDTVTDELDGIHPTSWGDDATVWAAEFMKRVEDGVEIDEGLMLGWFANAIEVSHDKRSALDPDKVTRWQDIATKLFCALDDIDTADDIAKDNEKLYRNLVRKAHKVRFEFQDLFPDAALPPAPEKEG